MAGRNLGTTSLVRSRFQQVWDYLPRLTILAALPGWGRSTLLRQCEARLLQRGETARLIWPKSRHELAVRLQERLGEADPAVWFVDDLLPRADDPLWQSICDLLAGDPALRVVAAAHDAPALEGLAPKLFDERDLAFDEAEVRDLVALNLAGPTADLTVIPPRMKGCPTLVQRRLEQVRAGEAQGVWTPPPGSPEIGLLPLLRPEDDTVAGGLQAVLRAARGLRTFTRDLLPGGQGTGGVV